jgi:hypothetical protein
MCVTLYDARLGQTMIAGWRFPRRRTHCLLYGNEPENLARVPNAMILHIPLAPGATLTRDNFIPTRGLRYVLEDMWAAAPKYPRRKTRTLLLGDEPERGSVQVFSMGSYTWVAATHADADEIHDALQQVPLERRPRLLDRELIGFYLENWPYDALAIGCFSRASGDGTEPACIEYPPQDWDILRYPATDAHGHRPRWGETVEVNHRIIVGTDELGLGGRVRYREAGAMDPRLAEVVPQLVVGAELARVPMVQGDFYVDLSRFGQDEARTGSIMRADGPRLNRGAEPVPALLAAPA